MTIIEEEDLEESEMNLNIASYNSNKMLKKKSQSSNLKNDSQNISLQS